MNKAFTLKIIIPSLHPIYSQIKKKNFQGAGGTLIV
jgi:hypothetical protein